jgi:predicted hydrocarbon binding protein
MFEKLSSVENRHEEEIAESVKVTMKALKEFYGLKSGSRRGILRSVGAEFGHIVARNIADSRDPQTILDEITTFWNTHGLGEMEATKEDPYTFIVRNCYDCIAQSAGDTLCGFKEGFISAILSDRTGGIGLVEEVECCGSGAESCKFHVVPFQKEA